MKSINKAIQLATATGLSLASSFSSLQAQDCEKPNVIFLLCDDLGFADIEAYGNQYIATPNINRLVNEGMSFTQNYAGASVSAPSRASLMTGLHTGHTKVRGNYEIAPEGQAPMREGIKTIAELFQSAGYTTGAFGKWGLGYPGSGSEPNDKGFDTFYGYNCQRQSHFYYPNWLWKNKEKVEFPHNKQKREIYSSDLIHQNALQFIRDNKDKQFFGYFAYLIPHASLEQPNDSILQMYKGKFYEKEYKGRHYTSTPIPKAQFAGMITRLDKYVGEIMAELEKQGIADNTIFIFTSDNGPHLEGGANPFFFNSEKWLTGQKRALYEGGIRVPMIIKWKNKVKAGTISHQPVAFWDMMPTFSDLLDVEDEWTQETDGISVLPTWTGEGEQKQHNYLYWEFHEEGGRQAVRKGKWKLIRQHIKTNPTLELYDLDTDLYEKYNLVDKYPEKVKELETIMDNARTPSKVFNFGRKK